MRKAIAYVVDSSLHITLPQNTLHEEFCSTAAYNVMLFMPPEDSTCDISGMITWNSTSASFFSEKEHFFFPYWSRRGGKKKHSENICTFPKLTELAGENKLCDLTAV